MPFLSNFIKGAAAASNTTYSSSEAPSGDAPDEEPSAEGGAGAESNDTAGDRADAPKAPVPDIYDLDLEKVDTLLEEDSVWLIATYAGAAVASWHIMLSCMHPQGDRQRLSERHICQSAA